MEQIDRDEWRNTMRNIAAETIKLSETRSRDRGFGYPPGIGPVDKPSQRETLEQSPATDASGVESPAQIWR